MKKILVIGASSGIGLQVCKVALQHGYEVTAFSRHATDMPLQHDNLTRFDGDALNYADVFDAMRDADVVIQALGVPMNIRLITGPITLFSRSTEVMLKVMHEKKVRRLLAITGFGAGDSINSIHPLQKIGFKMIFGRAYMDKDIQEQLIKESGLDWTIVRPGMLTNSRCQKTFRVLKYPSEWKNGVISRINVADFLISSIDDQDMLGASPVLIG